MTAFLKQILSFYTRFFVLWVLLFGVLAYACPTPFLFLKPGMKGFFALTMFGIGVVLKLSDFKHIATHPRIVLIGVCAQFTLMPFGAFLISKLFHFPDEIAIGLILTGAAPGAMTSNVLSYLAKADTAYSVSLTTVSTLLCPLLTPGLTLVLADAKMDVPFWGMFADVLLTVVLPLLAGFALRYLMNRKIERILPVFPALSATFIIFICALVIAGNRDTLPTVTFPILLAGIILNLYGMSTGYGVAALFRMHPKQRRTLSIEIGMQNAGLGVVLAMTHFGDNATLPAVFFVFVCIITASLMSTYWQYKEKSTT